ncbi:MAG TPA: hypothetical protein VNA25_24865 [Phycisphaerae bacterium]|nr:hypothetical protein [Phycisphaerae bacterium]
MDTEAVRHNILEPIRREYRAAFKTLRQTLSCIPQGQWLEGRRKINEPVRQVCHLLFGVESYLGGHKAKMGGRFGTAAESFTSRIDPKKCPRPSEILRWIDEVVEIADRHIERAVDMSLRGTARQHPPLNRVLYVLRHTTVHLSYLIWELRARGVSCRGY